MCGPHFSCPGTEGRGLELLQPSPRLAFGWFQAERGVHLLSPCVGRKHKSHVFRANQRESRGTLSLSLSFLSFMEKHTYHIHTQMHIPHAHPFKNSSFSYVTRLICVISLFATGCLKRFSVWVTQIWRQFLFGPLVSQLLPEWREDPEGVPRGSCFSLSVVRGESEEHGHDRVCSPPPVCCRIWK